MGQITILDVNGMEGTVAKHWQKLGNDVVMKKNIIKIFLMLDLVCVDLPAVDIGVRHVSFWFLDSWTLKSKLYNLIKSF